MSGQIAVISDIHSNLLALEAVARQLESDKPDAIYCLGDVTGYAAEPNECVELVRRLADGRTIVGNHDVVVTMQGSNEYEEYFNPDAKAAIHYQRKMLTPGNLAWLAELPESIQERDCLFYHGSPLSTDHYILAVSDLKAALDYLGEEVNYRILFTGHTHVPAAVSISADGSISTGVQRESGNPADVLVRLEEGQRYMVNPGSVGQPRDQVPAAAYALIDLDGGIIRFRRIDYDVKEAQRRIIAAGLPKFLAYRLEYGM